MKRRDIFLAAGGALILLVSGIFIGSSITHPSKDQAAPMPVTLSAAASPGPKDCLKIDEAAIAAKAHLGDEYPNRYQEDVIYGFCRNTPDDLKMIRGEIDSGNVTAQDAEAIAQSEGVQFKAPARSEEGKLYQKINSGLIKLGLCSACANNIASIYVAKPRGDIATLVDAALTGNQSARDYLQNLDTKNTPPVEQAAANPPLSKKPKSVVDAAQGEINSCLLRQMVNGTYDVPAVINCAYQFVGWCNARKIATNFNTEISPITGRVLFSNPRCAEDVDGEYQGVFNIYQAEMQNYAASENTGHPYNPVFFDIRKYSEAK